MLRAGIALTLAGNNEGVRALYREYAGDLAGTEEADAFEVVASGIHAEGAAIRDVARAVARTDLLDRFMTSHPCAHDRRSRRRRRSGAGRAGRPHRAAGACSRGACTASCRATDHTHSTNGASRIPEGALRLKAC